MYIYIYSISYHIISYHIISYHIDLGLLATGRNDRALFEVGVPEKAETMRVF